MVAHQPSALEVGRMLVELAPNRWRARYPVRGVSPFHVAPDLELADGLLKGQDIVIGADERFDREFVVASQDPVLMRRLWSAEACRALLAMRSPRVEGTLEEITVRTRSHRGEPAPIEQGLRLLEALDRADPLGIDLLEGWADGSYSPPAGGWADRTAPVLAVPGPIELLVEPVYVRGAAVTSVRARGRSERAIQDVDLRRMSASELDVSDGLRARVGAARIQQHGDELYLCWYQIVRDPAVLEAGISLMRALLRGPRFGPYR